MRQSVLHHVTPLKSRLSKLRKRVVEVVRMLSEIMEDDDAASRFRPCLPASSA